MSECLTLENKDIWKYWHSLECSNSNVSAVKCIRLVALTQEWDDAQLNEYKRSFPLKLQAAVFSQQSLTIYWYFFVTVMNACLQTLQATEFRQKLTGNIIIEGPCIYATVFLFVQCCVWLCQTHWRNGTIAIILTSYLAACMMWFASGSCQCIQLYLLT